MRLAMLQAALPTPGQAGGVGYQVALLANGLTRRGHDVTVFVVDPPPSDTAYRCVQVVAARGRARRIVGVGWAFAHLDLSGFDAIHAHGDDWLFGRRSRVRTFYGTALMEARTATRWGRRGSHLIYYGFEWVSSVNPRSVAISSRTRRYLPLVRSCVPCAFDPDVFRPGGDRTAEPSILFVAGTLAGRKRGELLLRAFEEVRVAVPDARLTVVCPETIAGPGITAVSNVAPKALADLYRSHWVLCSTSSYEGFGVPYVEALASGLPVVTTPNDGAREVLRNGELGVFAHPDTLGLTLISLLGDDARRCQLTRSGVEASARYSLDVVIAQYEEFYREIENMAASR